MTIDSLFWSAQGNGQEMANFLEVENAWEIKGKNVGNLFTKKSPDFVIFVITFKERKTDNCCNQKCLAHSFLH